MNVPYPSAGSPRIGEHVEVDDLPGVFVVWSRSPERGCWYVVPRGGGHARTVHYKAMKRRA